MGLGSATFLALPAALAVAAALGTAAAGAAALSATGADAPKLPRKFWNLALYCSKGLSAADARSGSARTAVVEKRILAVGDGMELVCWSVGLWGKRVGVGEKRGECDGGGANASLRSLG